MLRGGATWSPLCWTLMTSIKCKYKVPKRPCAAVQEKCCNILELAKAHTWITEVAYLTTVHKDFWHTLYKHLANVPKLGVIIRTEHKRLAHYLRAKHNTALSFYYRHESATFYRVYFHMAYTGWCVSILTLEADNKYVSCVDRSAAVDYTIAIYVCMYESGSELFPAFAHRKRKW